MPLDRLHYRCGFASTAIKAMQWNTGKRLARRHDFMRVYTHGEAMSQLLFFIRRTRLQQVYSIAGRRSQVAGRRSQAS
jgi:hypothetical protein